MVENINKIKSTVGHTYCNDKGFQGEQFVEKWFIDRWASEVDKKSSLKIYHGKWNNKKEAYINGSEGAKCFLAHLWCAYAMPLCLSWMVRRVVGGVCVEHNYEKMPI